MKPRNATMNTISSVKTIKIINRAKYKQLERPFTPIKDISTSIANKILESRNSSAEGIFKLKNTIQMYERIKQSVSPIKNAESLPIIIVKNNKKNQADAVPNKLTKISVKEYGIGNEYIKTLSSTVKKLPFLSDLNMKSNRISDDGAYSILASLNKNNMKVLDISNNVLGQKSVEALCEILTGFESSLETLCIENTKLGLLGFQKLVVALRSNSSLQDLNIANNKLGLGAGGLLKDLLINTSSLVKIDLHWNLIKGPEAIKFFEGMISNDTLLEVDISWNSIGNDPETIAILCNYLSLDSQLRHLDLSNNRISFASSQSMSLSIKSNHNLLGIHLEGNNCKLDHLGFIHPVPEISVSPSLQKSARILRTPRRINDHNCWICNKYVDFEVIWSLETINWTRKNHKPNGSHPKHPVFVHLEIDNYNPFKLSYANELYSAKRAVPKGKKIKFFFSCKGSLETSTEYETEKTDLIVINVLLPDGSYKELSTDIINYIVITDAELTCKPRPTIENYNLESSESSIEQSEWSKEKSIFAGGVWDDEVRAI